MRLSLDLLLDAPLPALFALLADPRERPRWQAAVRAVDVRDEGPPRLGTRWREHTRGAGSYDMEIAVFRPDEVWGERFRGEGVEGAITLGFAAAGERTRLAVTVELALAGWRRLARPLLPVAMPPAIRADLRRAARLAARSST